MTNYKELGLVNTKDMFAKAIKGGYAIPAYNFNNMEQLQAIIQACVETKSPVILQVSSGARKYANKNLLRNMARGAVEYAHELGYDIPIVLHLDHGDSFELCKDCIDSGFSSVLMRSTFQKVSFAARAMFSSVKVICSCFARMLKKRLIQEVITKATSKKKVK